MSARLVGELVTMVSYSTAASGVIWSSPYSGAFFAMIVIARMIGT